MLSVVFFLYVNTEPPPRPFHYVWSVFSSRVKVNSIRNNAVMIVFFFFNLMFKMERLLIFCCVFVMMTSGDAMNEVCSVTYCVGEAYVCINNECYCAEGYIPNHFQTRCVRCPGLGEKCFGSCCNQYGNGSLQCRQGICQPCYDSYGNWICRDSFDQMLLVSSTQIIMAAALILGIITTLILLYRLCAATANLQPLGSRPNYDSRLSIGSLQIYVEERLRDAPPRYTRTAPAGSSINPPTAYLNAGFTHDSSVPPPPYSPRTKARDLQTAAIHI